MQNTKPPKRHLNNYIWDTDGDRCCRTSRLLSKSMRAAPCLAVVYQVCPANHSKPIGGCIKRLLFEWMAFRGHAMTSGVLTKGTGTSLMGCQELAIAALVTRGILRETK